MAKDETGKPVDLKGEDPQAKIMETLVKKMISQVEVKRFDEPKTIQAVAAVSFKGDTVYCLNDRETEFAETAAKSFAAHLGCVIAHKLSTPEGLLDLLGGAISKSGQTKEATPAESEDCKVSD